MSERMYWYCRWCARVVPIVCACAHCLLVCVCGGMLLDGGHDVLRDTACVAVCMVQLGVLLPLNLLFGLGAVWRVPFVYAAGLCMGRLVCGTWALTAAMCCVCKVLMLVCAALYVWCGVRRAWLREEPGRGTGRHGVS